MSTFILKHIMILCLTLGMVGVVAAAESTTDQKGESASAAAGEEESAAAKEIERPAQMELNTSRSKGSYDVAPFSLAELNDYPELKAALESASCDFDRQAKRGPNGRAKQLLAYDSAYRQVYGSNPRYSKEDMDTLLHVVERPMVRRAMMKRTSVPCGPVCYTASTTVMTTSYQTVGASYAVADAYPASASYSTASSSYGSSYSAVPATYVAPSSSKYSCSSCRK